MAVGRLSPCALIVLALLSTAQADEARTYLSLWGNLFNKSADSGGPGAGAGFAQDVHSKLLQRLADYTLARHNQSLASLLGPAAPSPPPQPHLRGASPLAAPSDQLRSFFGGGAGSSGGGEPGPGLNLTALLSSSGGLWDRLRADLSKLDYHHLLSTAMLQGLVLTAMLNRHKQRSAAGLAPDGARAGQGGYVVQVADSRGDPDWAAFSPALCLGLQNFEGAEGFRQAYLGPPPCGSPDSAASVGLAWGADAAFLLQCTPMAPANGTTQSTGAAGPAAPEVQGGLRAHLTSALLWGGLAGASAAGGGGAGAAAGSAAAAAGGHLSCRLAVTSGSGRGALLQYGGIAGSTEGGGGAGGGGASRLQQGAPMLPSTGELNALRVRVCNMAPTTLNSPARLAGGGASSSAVTLRDLTLAGKPALRAPLRVPQGSGADGCVTQLYRLEGLGAESGAGAGSGGVVVSGWLELAEGSGAGFGVGELASVVVSLGQYSPQTVGR